MHACTAWHAWPSPLAVGPQRWSEHVYGTAYSICCGTHTVVIMCSSTMFTVCSAQSVHIQQSLSRSGQPAPATVTAVVNNSSLQLEHAIISWAHCACTCPGPCTRTWTHCVAHWGNVDEKHLLRRQSSTAVT